MLIFTHDKVRLEEHFRRDPVMFAYHLGDLDDFLFDRCQWGATYHKSTRIDECILIYRAPFGSAVLAFGLSDRFPASLEQAVGLLPDPFFGHFFADYRPILHRVFQEERLSTSARMKLERFVPHHDDSDLSSIRRLVPDDWLALTEFYHEAFPDSYFEPRMLETGKYFGWIDRRQIAAVAGVHVYSPQYRVAALGNIATHPGYRGRGIATRLTSRLTAELSSEGLLVCLNVADNNLPALRCYDKLGFVRAFFFEESRFSLK